MSDEEPQFKEGEEYDLDNLPESDMTNSGKLEMVGDGKLGARYGNLYVTFEWSTVECVDVTTIEELEEQ